ncbi:MAG: hypothetical protein V9G98_10105 [Candidatus Competibacter sp.]
MLIFLVSSGRVRFFCALVPPFRLSRVRVMALPVMNAPYPVAVSLKEMQLDQRRKKFPWFSAPFCDPLDGFGLNADEATVRFVLCRKNPQSASGLKRHQPHIPR